MVKLVTSLLNSKPQDPIPHIYSFLKEMDKGVKPTDAKPITVNEINEVKNLKKKVEYYRDLLNEKDMGDVTDESEEDSDDVLEEDIQPKKKNIKKQR